MGIKLELTSSSHALLNCKLAKLRPHLRVLYGSRSQLHRHIQLLRSKLPRLQRLHDSLLNLNHLLRILAYHPLKFLLYALHRDRALRRTLCSKSYLLLGWARGRDNPTSFV